MKTGTPPRVDGRSLDFTKMNEEKEMLIQISLIQMLQVRWFIKDLVI
jgi:tRNA U34 5-carboxymethylaminomethyl modifying enzyme MnmG/GidA